MNKILIIHPDDRSTDFLKPIYANVENPTLITGGCTKTQIKELIESHDQVIMLGHGSPGGLFSMGQFDDDTFGRGYIIIIQWYLHYKPKIITYSFGVMLICSCIIIV